MSIGKEMGKGCLISILGIAAFLVLCILGFYG
jgi:hypothetical protein